MQIAYENHEKWLLGRKQGIGGSDASAVVDVVNSGSIDAMIDSIIKTPELTESQKKYIDYYIEFEYDGIFYEILDKSYELYSKYGNHNIPFS